MKKKLIATVCASLLAFSLVSCGGEKSANGEKPEEKPAVEETENETGEFKAGTYEAETKEADEKGNKAKIVVTIDDKGSIAKVEYNEYNAEKNQNKRDNEEYNTMMQEKSGTSPVEFEPEFEKQILEKQSAEIDGVSGATGSSTKVKELAAAALANAKEGKTDKALI